MFNGDEDNRFDHLWKKFAADKFLALNRHPWSQPQHQPWLNEVELKPNLNYTPKA